MAFRLFFRQILLGFLLVFVILLMLDSYFFPRHVTVMESGFSSVIKRVSGQNYAIDTSGCRIPELNPFDVSIQNLTEPPPPFNCPCESGHGLTYLDNGILRVNTDVLAWHTAFGQNNSHPPDFYCCMWAMYRHETEEQDNFMRFPANCDIFRESIPTQAEYLKVECYLNAQRIHETFHINLIKKPKVEERCENAPKICSAQDGMGVIILFIDSVSRMNFRRNFPQSRQVLLEELRAIEMHGYNRVADNTFPNLVSLLSGLSEMELRGSCWKDESDHFDGCDFIWEKFAISGFRTAFIEDYPDIAAFNFEKTGFQRQPTDYYGHDFLKEAYKLMYLQRDCLNQISETEMIFKWCYDFAKFFKNQKYFGLFATSRFTHDNNVNRARLADPLLKKYLRMMKYDGLMDNVFLFVISDHGARYGEFRETVIGGREVNLPVFYVVPPTSFAKNFPRAFQNLVDNAHRLTTPYDLHETLKDIVHCDFVPPGTRGNDIRSDRQMISLFHKVPSARTCPEVGIPRGYCACYISEINLNHDLDLVQEAYRLVIAKLNNITEPYRKMCAVFVPNHILHARKIYFVNPENGNDTFYEITFFVKPGVGLFQGILTGSLEPNTLIVDPEISRLDMYGKTSACILHNSNLRKYCHCI